MKKYTSWFGVMLVFLFAACAVRLMPDGADLDSTMLTGQVLQRDADTVTLNLGELTLVQTPESAVPVSILPSDVTQTVRLSSHAAPNGQTWQNESRVFVSWQRDAVLDLSGAQCFALGQTGSVETITPETITPQDILNVTMDSSNTPVMVFVLTGVPKSEADTESLQGTAANLIDKNTSQNGGDYESTVADENALRVVAGEVSLWKAQVTKDAGDGSDREAGDRYGMNAALLATGGTNLKVVKSVVDSAATGGSGIFGHGSGTSVQLNDSTVTTTGDNAEGLQVSDGAAIHADVVTVTTAGDSSPVLWVKNGSLEIAGGTYMSGGYHSPAVFAAGYVRARNADLIANNSEAAVLRGSGTVVLENCNLRGSICSDTETTEQAGTVRILGGSGPAQESASFSMTGGSLSSACGAVFYAEDTDCELNLERVEIQNADGGPLLQVAGTTGEGATVTLTARRQTLEGNLVVNSDSALQLNLQDASRLQGAVYSDGAVKAGGSISVHIDRGCTWSLTGNSMVDTLENEGEIQYNGYSITLGDGTVLTS